MKKTIVLLLLIVVAFGISSCTTYDKNPLMKDEIAFNAETNTMWARPTEVTYEIMEDIEATAEFSRLFGFIPLGETPATDISSIFGTSPNSIGARCAAYDAMKSVGADGIYITSIHTTRKTGLVLKETVTVTGKALKLVNLGTVDQERADTVRYLRAADGLNQENLAPNILGSAFGALGNLFSFGSK